MDLTRLFAKPEAVYRQPTSLGLFVGSVSITVGLGLGIIFSVGITPDIRVISRQTVALALFLALGIWGVLEVRRRLHTAAQLKRHGGDLAAFCDQYGYAFRSDAYAAPHAFQGSSLLALPEQDSWLRHAIQAPGWQYVEFSYPIYRKTKFGEYKTETVYYGVMSTHLPRHLPHVFFDSKRARGRQFRWLFTRDQKHSLEGDFDEYFITYFPPDYSIDGLSFITPEVMWALKEASDYDIEIVDDRLYLYTPIYDDENRLHDMAVKLEAVKDKLLHNIITYRDERLPGNAGRMGVSAEGLRLKRSLFLERLSIAFIIAFVLLRIWLELSR